VCGGKKRDFERKKKKKRKLINLTRNEINNINKI